MDIFGTDGDDNIENLNSPGIHIWLNIYGGAGDDTIRVAYASVHGEAGDDTIIGARDYGSDAPTNPTAAYSNSPAGVTVNLATGVAQDGYGTRDTLKNIHAVADSPHSDLLIGSAGVDEFTLSGGSDVVFGAGGSDLVIMNNLRSTDVTTTYHIDTDTFTVAKATLAGGTHTLVDVSAIKFFGPNSDYSSITVTGAREAGETYVGGNGREIIYSGTGNDSIDAGAGLDTVIYSGARASYTVTKTETGATVTGAQGDDSLLQVERIHFADGGVAFDIDGIPGQAYRLYQAAFDRTPDAFGVGFWIAMMDNGVTLDAVARDFASSQEFKDLYSGASNAEVVAMLYENILDRAGDLEGISHWTGVLDRNEATVAEVLMGFSNSAEFIAKMVGVMEDGVAFLPYGG
ncbi:MAG TPA: DUF4214 domain-containing protein [Telluria sp.]